MSKNKAIIKIEANTEKAVKGIDKVTSQLNKMSKEAKSKLSTFAKLGSAVSGLTAAFSVVTKTLAAVKQVVDETTEAYKQQIKAEKLLETAAQNNPYLNRDSVKKLKDFAAQVQNIGNVGDETLLPLMSQLAASGRTQAEIQNIISAALDLSASGAMSLETAVSGLNKTFSGTAGQLSKLVPAVSSLTKEQLANGEAVKLISERYKGLYASQADSAIQAKNASGDLQEALGNLSYPAYDKWNRFLTYLASGVTSVVNKINGLPMRNWAIDYAMDFGKNLKSVRTDLQKMYAIESVKAMSDDELEAMEKVLEENKKERGYLSQSNQLLLEATKIRIGQRKEIAEIAKQEKLEAQQKAENDAKVNEALKKYNETIEKTTKELEAQKKAGLDISETEELQRMLDIRQQAYITYYKEVGELGKTQGEKILAEIQQNAEALGKALGDTSESRDWITNFYRDLSKLTDENLKEMQDQMSMMLESTELTEEEKYTITKKWEEETAKLRKAKWTENLEQLKKFVDSYAQISSELSDILIKKSENEASVKTAALEKQYADGIISEKEYNAQKEKIEKEAAMQSYKAQMWQWSSTLVQIGANAAASIASTLAQESGPAWVKIAMAATVGTMAAAQLATALANKPVAPSFATGGIVGGNSYSGDRVQANVNSGEMILNSAQQLALWKAATGQSANNGLKVDIKNYVGQDTNVNAQLDGDTLKIVIDRIVQSSLNDGTYNRSLQRAQNSFNGVNYSN
ncbi:MAG: hypothetical protein IJL70_01050 [Treponema sp.]|nr:hypothetical protein [Treponema sp.]MBQ6056429.1 hypothetical protein [Treponema sp.]